MFTKYKSVFWVLSVLFAISQGALVSDLAAQIVHITPLKGKVVVGSTKLFELSGQAAGDYTWAVIDSGYAEGVTIGTIDSTGLFTALNGGYVIIAAMEEDIVIASTDTIFVVGGPTRLRAGSGGKVFAAGDTSVVADFPPDACETDMTVMIQKRAQNELQAQAQNEGAVAVFEFNATDTETNEDIGKTGFQAWVRLTLHYNDEDIPEGVNEGNLGMTTFNEENKQWQKVPEENVVEVDPERNTITVRTNHASLWSVMDVTSLVVAVETTTWGQIKSRLK